MFNTFAENQWDVLAQVMNGQYQNLDIVAELLGNIHPESIVNTDGIVLNETSKTFMSQKDKDGYGAHLGAFLASLNNLQAVAAYLYFLAVPAYSADTQKAEVVVPNKNLKNNIVDFYYRAWTYLYRTGIEKFKDFAAFEGIRTEIGDRAAALNKAIRDENALEVNGKEAREIIDYLKGKGIGLSKEETDKLEALTKEKVAFYDIMQLATVLNRDNFVRAFKYLKVEDVPEVLSSEKFYEVFDATGRIGRLGWALRFSADMNNNEKGKGYYPKYMIRRQGIKAQGEAARLADAKKTIVTMVKDKVIETSGLKIKTKNGEMAAISDLIKANRLTFVEGKEAVGARQDFRSPHNVKCAYPVTIMLDGEDVGTIYIVDTQEFADGVRKIVGDTQDNVPRPCVISEKDGQETYFGLMTDATPGGVVIGDGIMEQLLEAKDYEKLTAWQTAAVKVLPESGRKTLERLAELMGEMKSDEATAIQKQITEGLEKDMPLMQIVKGLDIKKIKELYSKHPDKKMDEKACKARILGGAEAELLRLQEFLAGIENNRITEEQTFFYLKAQITKQLLLPQSGGIHFMGKNTHKLPMVVRPGARFLTPTSCSTNGSSYFTQALIFALGKFGQGKHLTVVGTTAHGYTTGDTKGIYGDLNPKSTGAAKGTLLHLNPLEAIFTAVRTATAQVNGKTEILGGSTFDMTMQFNDPVDEKDLKNYFQRVAAEYPEIVKVFTPDIKDDGKYMWEKTISGQRTGSILFIDYIERVDEKTYRLIVGYDNEMSYSFKMNELVSKLMLLMKREKAMRQIGEIVEPITRSANEQHMRRGAKSNEKLTPGEVEGVNKAICATIAEDTNAKPTYKEVNDPSRYKGTFVVLDDATYEKYAKHFGVPIDLDCTPGTNGTRHLYTNDET
ncbi:MAG: hypothetical protein PHW46_06580, partial [Candidatus Omnitrophica bacterium]|nr:hypothetical protein [Candidatus Omnitrophota bacterium]